MSGEEGQGNLNIKGRSKRKQERFRGGGDPAMLFLPFFTKSLRVENNTQTAQTRAGRGGKSRGGDSAED